MSIRVNRKTVILYIIIIFFLCRFYSLDFISSSTLLTRIYTIISQIIFACIVIWYFLETKGKFKWNDIKFLACVLLLFVYMIVVTVLESGDISRLIGAYYPLIGFICFFNIVSKKHPFELIFAFTWFLFVLVVINFLDITFFSDLSSSYSTTYFFLGGRNHLAITFSIGFAFVEVYTNTFILEQRRKNLFVGIYIAIIIISSILSQSATTMIAVGILIIFRFLRTSRVIRTLLNPIVCLCSYAVVWGGLVFLRIHELFENLITLIFSRNNSLTFRTQIWDVALPQIGNKLIFGHGVRNTVNVFTIKTSLYTSTSLSAHNQILQSLYEGGIVSVGLLILCFLVGCCGKGKKTKAFEAFFCALIGILVVCLSESPDNTVILLGIAFCVMANQFKFEKEEVDEENT